MSKSYGELLRELRERASLTQKIVADKLGYSTPQFVSNWERGLSTPPISSLKRLASVYKVDPEMLFEATQDAIVEVVRFGLRKEWEKSPKKKK